MTKDLLRILYSSKSHIPLSESDITALLQQSRKYNQSHNIKGILCYSATDFLQVLEGPETVVLKLYQHILHDPRHHDCKLINICLSPRYIFADWSMGYINMLPGDMRRLRQELPEKLSNDNTDQFALQLKNYLTPSSRTHADDIVFI